VFKTTFGGRGGRRVNESSISDQYTTREMPKENRYAVALAVAPELLGHTDDILSITRNVHHKRNIVVIRTPTATHYSLPMYLHTLEPRLRFAVGEWVDATRKSWGRKFQDKHDGMVTRRMPLKDQTAITPPSVYTFLTSVWGLTQPLFDPCPAHHTGPSGLDTKWKGPDVYVNPPFKHVDQWVRKTLHELAENRAVRRVAMLLPARFTPAWMHDLVLPHAHRLTAARGSIRFQMVDGGWFPKPLRDGIVLVLLHKPHVSRPFPPNQRAPHTESFDFLALDRPALLEWRKRQKVE
jgi:hypothetical protein